MHEVLVAAIRASDMLFLLSVPIQSDSAIDRMTPTTAASVAEARPL